MKTGFSYAKHVLLCSSMFDLDKFHGMSPYDIAMDEIIPTMSAIG